MRLHLDDESGLFSGHLSDLRGNLELLQKHLYQHDGLIEPVTWARIQDRVQELEMALLGLECDTCQSFATVDRDAGQFCESCLNRYAICAGCGEDVLIDDAIEAESVVMLGYPTFKQERRTDFFHGPCAPDERVTPVLDMVSGQ